MKLAVCWPWDSPFVFSDFVDATLDMVHPPGYEVKYIRGTGWASCRRHVDLCEKALDWGADLICIIGADQVHPPDMLLKLTKRFEEGCDVITALVPFRGYVDWQGMKPFQLLGWRLKCEGVREYVDTEACKDMLQPINPGDGDLQRVQFIGSGVLMFQREHLMSIQKPWFFHFLDPESMRRTSDMDSHFVWRLQAEAGAKVWVDTTIKVKHLHIFQIDDTYSSRFSDGVF